MQFIKRFVFISILLFPFLVHAQSVSLTPNSKHNHFVDRMEILSGKLSTDNYSTLKPFYRNNVAALANYFDSVSLQKMSRQDAYNLLSLKMNNAEWFTVEKEKFKSKKVWLKGIYENKASFFEHDEKDFFLSINPVLSYQQSFSSGNDLKNLFISSRGLTLRSRIANKIGVYFSLWDNQERGPAFVRNRIVQDNAVPGANFYKTFKTTAVDYFDGRGGITFGVTKYITVQFSYDKNFIGNGYRSLFLSDWGGNYLFLKLNTKIWKFDLQNLFMELNPKYIKTNDELIPKKYAAMHHLSINVTKWLNVGAFESVVFGRKDHFEFGYLNPVIFYRTIEGNIGSPDNVMLGFDFKANVAKRFQFYGQLLIDELNFQELRKDKTWWGNKFGFQIGGKYINAFSIPNLDLQAELNTVRPFTYSHYKDVNFSNFPVANYSHYNQPLAHPLGANFRELIGIARYQPIPKLFLYGRIIYSKQGLDTTTSSRNFGGNIFRANDDKRIGDYGYSIGNGLSATTVNALLVATYELKENLFFDVSYQMRKYTATALLQSENVSIIGVGIRLNIARREYDF